MAKTFNPRSTCPTRDNEYYNYGPFVAGGYGMWENHGNCTAYAFGRFHEILGKKSDKSGYSVGTGDGCQWYSQATGYNKGQKPAVGAICCWNHNTAGHVAVIEEIGKDYIIVSESGYNYDYFWTSAHPYNGNKNWYRANEGYTLNGYIYNPALEGVKKFGKVTEVTYVYGNANIGKRSGSYTGNFSTGGSGNSSVTDTGEGLNLQQTIAQLYTSDNYKWAIDPDKLEETNTSELMKIITEDAKKRSEERLKDSFGAEFQKIILKKIEQKKLEKLSKIEKKLVKGNLTSFPNLVQAPYIELEMNGIKIGGYKNSADKYPNHITSLNIEKINGRINNYTISLTHQVRAGEDPNLIDTVLSRTGYRNKIKIKYGDSAYGSFFKEDEAYIMDVTHSENVASANISYTIKAVSSVNAVQEAYFDFAGINSKPSAEIIKMLYQNKETSKQLLELLEGMRNQEETLGKGWIPSDDDTIYIPGLKGASLLDRLTQLVSYMHDSTSPESSYFLMFDDSTNNSAHFQIKKINPANISADSVKNCYYVDIGYPGNSFVTQFSIENDVYWPMFYEYADSIPNYSYDIDYTGDLITKKVNPLIIDNKYQDINVKDMNWWNFVKTYPISATITIKGLMKPTMLMENVYVYAQFYGEEDMASGLYSIIGQQDTINGQGYSTTLQLLRTS